MSLILRDQLIYGTPPTGLDVRLSLDLNLQARADELLGEHTGAIIVMNAETGEILVMASHPTYDPNKLDEEGDTLSQDKTSPLLNRAAQGLYPIGNALSPLIEAQFGDADPSESQLMAFYNGVGLFQAPLITLPVASSEASTLSDLRGSPLQVCMAASMLSHQGILPAPRIATAVNTLEQGWLVLPALGEPRQVIQAEAAAEAALGFIREGDVFWSHSGSGNIDTAHVSWFIAGTLPEWQGTPLALVVALEEKDSAFAEKIGQTLLSEILNP